MNKIASIASNSDIYFVVVAAAAAKDPSLSKRTTFAELFTYFWANPLMQQQGKKKP